LVRASGADELDDTHPIGDVSAAGEPRRRSSTIRAVLTWAAIAWMIPAWLCISVGIVAFYGHERDRISQTTISTARALMTAVDNELAGKLAAAQVLAMSPYLRSADFAAFHREASELVPILHGNSFVLADASGQEIVNTLRPYGEKLPFRSNTKNTQTVFQTGKPAISDAVFGAVSKIASIAIDVPVVIDGAVKYTLALAISSSRLAELLTEQRLPSDWVTGIFDASGVMAARTANPEQFVGQKASPTLLSAMAGAATGFVESSTKEHIAVLAAFSRSQISGWSVAIGVPTAELYGNLWKFFLFCSVGALILLIASIAFASLQANRIVRAIQGLIAPALALGRGEMPGIPRLHVSEADDVAQALDRAFRVLERRTVERDQADAARRAGEQKLSVLVDHALDGMIAVSRHGIVEHFNPACERIFGYRAEEVLGQNVKMLMPQPYHDEHDNYLSRYIHTGAVGATGPTGRNVDAKRKDGSVFPIELSINAFQSENRRYFSGIVRDVSARVAAEQRLKESEARYRILAENSTDMVFQVDLDLVRRYVSPACREILGYEPEELIDTKPIGMIHPDDAKRVEETYRAVLNGRERASVTNRIRHRDGHWVWVEAELRLVRDQQSGKAAGILGSLRDVSARRAAEERLSESECREREKSAALKITLAHMSQGLSMFDADERLTVWNERYIAMYGISPEIVRTGVTFTAIIEHRKANGNLESEVAEFVADLRRKIAEGRTFTMLTQLKDGRVFSIVTTPTEGGGWVATHEDVTERHGHETRISFMAHHDLLTGLANRAYFSEKIEDAVARLRRHGEPFAILMLDLDKFKHVNDTFGHPAGDQLLKETAQRLKAALRETDVLARLGGDEFAIIQSGQTNPREDAVSLANRIVKVISQPYDLDGNIASVGTSIGIALAPDDADASNALLKLADHALYAAKSAGRNGFKLFEASMLAETDNRRQLEMELRAAITHGEFELHYQALVDVKTRRPAGFEALVRWRHPTRGLVMPDQFIPLAEETGLIVPLGEWILQQACADAAKWPSHMKVAVNLSPIQLAQPDLLQVVLYALVESSLAPERLELEITETALFEGDVDYATLILQLKKLGVAIALDDFGTGYSSLSYLTMFPFDKIKIDQSFTMNLTRRADCAAIVSAVLALGRGLDTETVAEGVESEQHFAILRAAGVTYVQGYLFGRPCPVSELVLGEAGLPGLVESATLVPDNEPPAAVGAEVS